jgi:anti-sigma-K factor RskA
MSIQSHELHLLTGAYAADAVTGAELAEFEKHLAGCATCAEEVRGLRETTARLGMTTAIAPPPWMREQVLAAASRTRQLPPISGKVVPLHARPRRMKQLRHSATRPVAVAAMAAMAAAVIVLAVFQVNTQDQLHQTQAGDRAVAAVLAAPDAHIKMSKTSVGGTVTAVFSRRDGEAVITTAGMPTAGGSKIYQLWVITAEGVARSAGLISGGITGATSPVLAGDVRSGDSLAITIEPAGGSAQPTTSPVVLLAAYT